MTEHAPLTEWKMPAADRGGRLVPTLNKYGRMLTTIVEPVPAFIEAAVASPHWALDVGSAYGVNTIAAIDAGAKVVANDLDARHLQILTENLPPEKRASLRTVCGPFPDVDFAGEKFSAILACRVLHFFDGPTLERAAKTMFELLLPGGRAFVRAMTPYIGISEKARVMYEKRKAKGDQWPGFVADVKAHIDDPEELAVVDGQVHFLDPEILSSVFSQAGFTIERAEYVAVNIEPFRLDGREGVVLVARKP